MRSVARLRYNTATNDAAYHHCEDQRKVEYTRVDCASVVNALEVDRQIVQ